MSELLTIEPKRNAKGKYDAEVVFAGRRKLAAKNYPSHEAAYLAASDWAAKRLKIPRA